MMALQVQRPRRFCVDCRPDVVATRGALCSSFFSAYQSQALPVLSPDQIVAKFEAIDAHDDTVEGIFFHPPAKRGGKSSVTVTLFRHWERTRRLVTFNDCANIETIVDSDVLKDNAPNNTRSFEARADAAEIEALMRRQKKSWNVSYEKNIDPLPKKLTKAPNLILLRIRLCGGSVVIVAKSFAIKRLTLQSIRQTTARQA